MLTFTPFMQSVMDQAPSLPYEPQGRFDHCSAIINGKQYTYGGNFGAAGSPSLSVVEIFDPLTEKWQQIPTSGQPPPGYIHAACAVIGVCLFHFGGYSMSRLYNTIHRFDTTDHTWNRVFAANPREAPPAMRYVKMISYDGNLLVTGWTSKLHCFNVHSSKPYIIIIIVAVLYVGYRCHIYLVPLFLCTLLVENFHDWR